MKYEKIPEEYRRYKYRRVEDELPPKGETVICYHKKRNYYFLAFVDDNGIWFSEDTVEMLISDPTHWMPLPEPPKA